MYFDIGPPDRERNSMDAKRLILGMAVLGGAGLWRALRRAAPVDLRDKVVIVTGASSGIGLAVARGFAAEGARLVLAARRTEKLHEIADELTATYGASTLVVPTDVTEEAGCTGLVEAAMARFGYIDVLVNNAGVTMVGAFHMQDPGTLQQLLQVNVYGYLRLTQLVIPSMLRRRAGHIVNVGSVVGRFYPPGMVGYVASRAAILGFTEALRRELTGTGICVSLVMPTWTRTAIASEAEFDMVASAGLPVDDVETPAAAIIEAVRRRRRTVMLGGVRMAALFSMEALAPRLVDWLVRGIFYFKPDFAAMLFGSDYERV